MACFAYLVCHVSTVSGRCKNPLEEQALVAGKKKLEQSTFLRYICNNIYLRFSFNINGITENISQ